MKKLRGLSTLLAAALLISGIAGTPADVTAAKKPVLNKKTASIVIGNTVKIKLNNATSKAKVKWTTSKKKVAKITKSVNKGKKASATVLGVTSGKSVIKAVVTVGKKKVTTKCTVTVKKEAATAVPVVPSATAVVTKAPIVTGEPSAEPTSQATATPTRTPKVTKAPTPEPTPKYEKPSVTAEPAVALSLVEGCLINENEQAIISYNEDKTLTVEFNTQWSAINFYLPDNAKNYYSEYKYVTLIYNSTGEKLGHALYDANTNPDGSGAGAEESGKHPDWGQKVEPSEEDKVLQFAVTDECVGGCIRGLQVFNPNDTGKITTINIKNVIISTTDDYSSALKPVVTEYKAVFTCDEHAKITTYRTKDYTLEEGKAENQTEALARNSETGEVDVTGEGQVNFTVVVDEGYEVDSVLVTPEGAYNGIKTPADTKYPDTYRVTKITDNITIAVTTKEKTVSEYTATFECDEHATITTYSLQNIEDVNCIKADNQTTAIVRNSITGEPVTDGTGQINFKVVLDEGYVVDYIEATEGKYSNIKPPTETTYENTYRITKITDNITVKVHVKEASSEEVTQYNVAFDCGDHATITTYTTQDYTDAAGTATNQTTAIVRNSDTGEIDISGEGQVNFTVVVEAGYKVDDVEVLPESNYNKVKSIDAVEGSIPDNTYRITKVCGDITIKVTIVPVA